MSHPESQHPAFDPEEHQILSELKPDDEPLPPEDGAAPAEEQPAAEVQPQETAAAPAEAPAAAPAEAPAAAPAAAGPAEAPAPAPAPAPAEQERPQGDTRAALRAARTSERRLRDENEQLRRDLEQARKDQPTSSNVVSDEELEQLEQDFPVQAKLVRRQRELEQQIAETRSAAPPPSPEFEALSYPPQVQEVIDSVPDLLAWQYDANAQDKFQRAIAYDNALRHDPDWKDKSPAERFAEAAERTKRAFGSAPAPAPTPAPSPSAAPAAAAIAAAPASGPKGISDFRGGGPANPTQLDYSQMSDEEVIASLTPTS